MDEKHKDFYLKLRKEIKEWVNKNIDKKNVWSDYILIAPDMFHLLVKLTLDKDVPASKKVKLAVVIAYFISPIDLLPEAILGPMGYLDDVALAAYILNEMIIDLDPQIVKRNWAGEHDILILIKNIVSHASHMLGGKLWQRLKGRLK
ncbi:MAG: DUF1232 domain-containing protein [bacterium]